MAQPTKKRPQRFPWLEYIQYKQSKLTLEIIQKLDQAFSIGATVDEACDYADIAPSTYFSWTQKYPELSEHFKRIRNRLPLKAKQNIAQTIHNGDLAFSRWLIERFQPEEYGETIKVEHTMGDETPAEDQEAIERFHAELRANRIKRRMEKARRDGEPLA